MRSQRMGLLKLLWEIKILPLIVIIIALGVLSTGMAWAHWNEQYIGVKVIDKHIDVSTSGIGTDKETTSHYVVVTDKGAFEVDTPLIDRIFNMESRNADVNYALIEKNKSYGYRINILWTYPIVTDIKEVS